MTTAVTAEAKDPPPHADGGLPHLIAELLLASPLVARDDPDFHRRHIAWEFESGQWVMLADDRDRLLGWLSWYRVRDATLTLLRELDIAALERIGRAEEALTAGPHLYFATALVAPWAPAGTFLRLCQLAAARNQDAETVSWHRRTTDGQSHFYMQAANHSEIGL